jgi:hypothetical protein
VCADLQTSNSNCGVCGVACSTGATCTAGLCQCDPNLVACPTGCANLSNDATNCGSCGNACAVGQSCVSGQCTACPGAGEIVCNNVCSDVSTDVNNCGSCGNACGPNTICTSGVCGCAAGQTYCGPGNGCVGRALASWEMIRRGFHAPRIAPIEEIYSERRSEYEAALDAVESHQQLDLSAWLEFTADCLLTALRRAEAEAPAEKPADKRPSGPPAELILAPKQEQLLELLRQKPAGIVTLAIAYVPLPMVLIGAGVTQFLPAAVPLAATQLTDLVWPVAEIVIVAILLVARWRTAAHVDVTSDDREEPQMG